MSLVLITAVSVPVSQTSAPVAGAEEAAPALSTAAPLRDHVRLGAYAHGMVADPTKLTALEQKLGKPVSVASYFYGFGDHFPASIERGFADGGRRDVLLSWDMGPTRFTDWSSGRHNDYLRLIGNYAKNYPYPIYVRPWPEMNGDWQDFQPTAAGTKRYGGTPAEFVAAWRHVVNTVRAAGGTNVRWVFNPTADTYAETTDVRTIWPGSEYVDVLGLDGYNWGNGGIFRWRSFSDIFTQQYARLTALHPTAPVWICEFGSKEPLVDDGAPVDPLNSKAAWLSEAFASTAFPRIAVLATFDENKERDWRTDSSPAALEAMRSAIGTSAVVAPPPVAPPPVVTVEPPTTTTPAPKKRRKVSGTASGVVTSNRRLAVRWTPTAQPTSVAKYVIDVRPRAGTRWTRVGAASANKRAWRGKLPQKVRVNGAPVKVRVRAVNTSGRRLGALVGPTRIRR